MHRMPLLVDALDLPWQIFWADLMDQRDKEYGKPMGAFFPDEFLIKHGLMEKGDSTAHDMNTNDNLQDGGEG